MITKKELMEAEEILAKATKGKWHTEGGSIPGVLNVKGLSFGISIILTATDLDFKDYCQRNNDAIYITHMDPEFVSRLIETVKAGIECAEFYADHNNRNVKWVLESRPDKPKYTNVEWDDGKKAKEFLRKFGGGECTEQKLISAYNFIKREGDK